MGSYVYDHLNQKDGFIVFMSEEKIRISYFRIKHKIIDKLRNLLLGYELFKFGYAFTLKDVYIKRM